MIPPSSPWRRRHLPFRLRLRSCALRPTQWSMYVVQKCERAGRGKVWLNRAADFESHIWFHDDLFSSAAIADSPSGCSPRTVTSTLLCNTRRPSLYAGTHINQERHRVSAASETAAATSAALSAEGTTKSRCAMGRWSGAERQRRALSARSHSFRHMCTVICGLASAER